MKNFIITLDGPSGSGKSTIAKKIANLYNLTYLDTGSMYRMLSLYAIDNNLNINDSCDIDKLLSDVKMEMKDDKFFLNGKDVTSEIRTPKVNSIVSDISKIKKVRENLVTLQRELGKNKKIIIDGRDIGSVVFPDADLKFFLVASPEIRAERRYKEFLTKGIHESFANVLESMKERDYIDSHREESPLIKPDDSIEIDATNLTIEQVLDIISSEINKINK